MALRQTISLSYIPWLHSFRLLARFLSTGLTFDFHA